MILYRLLEPILITTCVYNSICNLAMIVLVLEFVGTQAFRQMSKYSVILLWVSLQILIFQYLQRKQVCACKLQDNMVHYFSQPKEVH